jgi:hypothetical protein
MTYTVNRQKLTGQGMTQGYVNKDKPGTPTVEEVVATAPVVNTRRPGRPAGRPTGRPAPASPGTPQPVPAGSASTAATPKKKKGGGGTR